MTTTNRRNSKRRAIPPATKQLVLLEAGYKCANPTCRHILTLELHHIVWVKDSGSNEPSNLIALCPNCHALHTGGHIPHEAVRVWKSMLLALNNINRANLDVLLHLYKQSKTNLGKHILYSGDALLHLAGLLNAGLLETGSAQASSGGGGFAPYSSFEVSLTEAGLMLVDAWLTGNEAQFNAILSQRSKS